VSDPVSARSIAELRGMSDEDLIAAHDSIAELGRSVETADNYRAELARRDADKQTRTMLCLTKWIAVLTVANVVLVAYSVFR
jgi:hypothetical protein